MCCWPAQPRPTTPTRSGAAGEREDAEVITAFRAGMGWDGDRDGDGLVHFESSTTRFCATQSALLIDDRQKCARLVSAHPPPPADEGVPVTSVPRSEEHTSELQSLMRISYAVFCLKKHKKQKYNKH